MMLGYLLARAGVDDGGAREARRLPARLPRRHGPSVDAAHHGRARPARRVPAAAAPAARACIGGWFGDERVQLGDFTRPARALRLHRHDAAVGLPRFPRRRGEEAAGVHAAHAAPRSTGLIEDDGRVVGVRGTSPDGDFEIRADLHDRLRRPPFDRARAPPACRSRTSARRSTCSGSASAATRPTIDSSLARIAPGHFVVTIDRGDYWQCAFVIPKGGAEALQRSGIEAFRAAGGRRPRRCWRAHIDATSRSWDDVKLLTVAVDRLTQWSKPGLLCIGDAAHAMSPIGGVGINLAIQDAVAAANLLAGKLRAGTLDRRRPRRRARAPPLADQGDAGDAGRDPEQRARAGDRRRATPRSRCRCRCACSPRCRRCSACSRACSAWACGRSTCARPRPERREPSRPPTARRAAGQESTVAFDDLHYLEIDELARLIAARKVSPVELTEAMLRRIERLDPALKSYALVTPELALAQARARRADDRRGARCCRSCTACRSPSRTCAGPKASRRRPACRCTATSCRAIDATVVRKLREAGAVLLGKLQLTEGAFADHHPDVPPPVNPWHRDHWSGASSSGSGVATAAGLCFGSLGSDTGGSIRFPSAANGITGPEADLGPGLALRLLRARRVARPHRADVPQRGRRRRSCCGAIAGSDPRDPTALPRRRSRLPRRRRRHAARPAHRLRRALRARRRRRRDASRGRGGAGDGALARRRDRRRCAFPTSPR